MNYLIALFLMAFSSSVLSLRSPSQENKYNNQFMQMDTTIDEALYEVTRLPALMKIDGNWNKRQWSNVPAIKIANHMGSAPRFVPTVEAKMMYNEENVFVIFRVQDKFVHSTVTDYNGPVSENSCVEFFFSPDTAYPLRYFNLEINAGGTPLIFYISKPWSGYKELTSEEISSIEIAHSLPKVVDPEMKEAVTWTIEYRIPLDILKKYSNVTTPAPGIKWKGNFYKTGSKTSNPNYMTWSVVDHPTPNFHLPQYFGTLVFR